MTKKQESSFLLFFFFLKSNLWLRLFYAYNINYSVTVKEGWKLHPSYFLFFFLNLGNFFIEGISLLKVHQILNGLASSDFQIPVPSTRFLCQDIVTCVTNWCKLTPLVTYVQVSNVCKVVPRPLSWAPNISMNYRKCVSNFISFCLTNQQWLLLKGQK